MWHMYVTSPPIELHQRHPVGLPSSGSGDQSKWYTPGAEDSKLNQIVPRKLEKTIQNIPDLPGTNWIQLAGTQPPQNVHQALNSHLMDLSIMTTRLNTREHLFPTNNHLTTEDLGLTIIMEKSMKINVH